MSRVLRFSFPVLLCAACMGVAPSVRGAESGVAAHRVARLEGVLMAGGPAQVETDPLLKAVQDVSDQIVGSLTSSKRMKVAVVDLINIDGGTTKLGRILGEELITRLFLSGKVEVIERNLLNKVLTEQQMTLSGLMDPDSAKKIGKILGLDAIVTGTLSDLSVSIRINARVISTDTGQVIGVAAATLTKDSLVEKLASEFLDTGTGVGARPAAPPGPGKAPEVTSPKTPELQPSGQPGLRAEFFNLAPFEMEGKGSCPAFEGSPSHSTIAKSLGFNANQKAPAPNVSQRFFGVRWSGNLHIQIAGTYELKGYFDRRTDGWYVVYLDKKPVASWSRYDYTVITPVFIKSGNHAIEIQACNADTDKQKLELTWKTPGSATFEEIPTSVLSTP